MKDCALLLRLNPRVWPSWETKIAKQDDRPIWFTIGRRRKDRIGSGIQVVVLGTSGLGVLANGVTVTEVEYREDPDWHEVDLSLQESYRKKENRIGVRLRPVRVPLSEVVVNPKIENIHRRARETITWLSSNEYYGFSELVERHIKSELSTPFAPTSLTPR